MRVFSFFFPLFFFSFVPTPLGMIADFYFCWSRSSPWWSKEQTAPKDQNSSPLSAFVWSQRRGSGFE